MGLKTKKKSAAAAAAATAKKQSAITSKADGGTAAAAATNDQGGSSQQQQMPKGVFTHPQLTSLIFMAMGISRVFEWKRAQYEIAKSETDGGINTEKITLCETYLVYESSGDGDDGSSNNIINMICSPQNKIASTLITIQYDLVIQLLFMTFYIILQCWNNEYLINRLNTIIYICPISTTLLLLQMTKQYISSNKINNLLLSIGTLTAVSYAATIQTIREVLTGSGSNNDGHRPRKRGTIQSLFLSCMVFYQIYELYQWWCTSQILLLLSSAAATTTTMNDTVTDAINGTSILSSDFLIENTKNTNTIDSSITMGYYHIFIYCIIMTKITMTLLLSFVWLSFDTEQRQRSFLLCFAALQGYNYSFMLSNYDASVLTNLNLLQTMTLTCCFGATICWLLPSFGF